MLYKILIKFLKKQQMNLLNNFKKILLIKVIIMNIMILNSLKFLKKEMLKLECLSKN